MIYGINLAPSRARLSPLRRVERRRWALLHQVRIHAAASRRGGRRAVGRIAPGGNVGGRSPRPLAETRDRAHGVALSFPARPDDLPDPRASRLGRSDPTTSRWEVLHPLSHHHLAGGRLLSGMSASPVVRRSGRRGRRTGRMVRTAAERISDLFALAEKESTAGSLALADRYVALARRIGMRYNVRLLAEYRELYCRGCSRYWVEGRTVRTRLRRGRRVRTCLGCGRERRIPVRPMRTLTRSAAAGGDRPPIAREEGVLVGAVSGVESEESTDEETEET